MTFGSPTRPFLTTPNLLDRAVTAWTAAWVALACGPALASPAAHGAEPAHGAAAAPHAVGHHDGITLFNWPNAEDHRIGLAYLVINFVVLAFLIHRLILRKLVQDNVARHDDIKRQVDEAASALREAQSVIADYKQRVARIETDSQQILDEARQAADADRRRLQGEAETEVERFKASAMAAAQREVDSRKAELEHEVVDRAIARATELLQARLTDSDHTRMVDDFAIDLASRSSR